MRDVEEQKGAGSGRHSVLSTYIHTHTLEHSYKYNDPISEFFLFYSPLILRVYVRV